jgi:DNA-binding transcriptional ArsR family regulator
LTTGSIVYNHMVMEALIDEEALDRAFAALAHPARRAIIASLASTGDSAVLELAAPLPMSQPAVTKHLNVLEAAGLISRQRQAQRRVCHLEADRLKYVSDWVGSYREFWEQSFERMDSYLGELQKGQQS